MKVVHQAVSQCLKDNQPVVLATIISSQGSTPRKSGAKMAILNNGSILGSVGGGALEAAVEKVADDLLTRGGGALRAFNLSNSEATDLGMICGGEQQILLTMVEPNEAHRQVFDTLTEPGDPNDQRYLVSRLGGRGPDFAKAEMGLLYDSGKMLGLSAEHETVATLKQQFTRRRLPILTHVGDEAWLIEKDFSQGSLFIFGAGHVAQPTVAMASMVGFQTIVVDDREEFANQGRFPRADQVVVLPDFANALGGFSIAEDAYIVIITRGHAHDQTVLEQALATPAAYIGMIGSMNKIRSCFEQLRKQGWSQEALDRVHAPIGLKIGSDTPEEIAVSIAAEVIQARSQLRKKSRIF
jgi:xanthine dehydrogenase accessory factor